jgi:hypothetical protein
MSGIILSPSIGFDNVKVALGGLGPDRQGRYVMRLAEPGGVVLYLTPDEMSDLAEDINNLAHVLAAGSEQVKP